MDEHELVDETVVYQLVAAPGASCWRAPAGELDGLANRKLFDDWTPPRLELVGDQADIPVFSWINGLTCGFVLRVDLENNPATSSFSHQAGWVLELEGDAKGLSLVVPQVGRAIDTVNTVKIDEPAETKWVFTENQVEEHIFRSVPRLDVIFCGEYQSNHDDPITDLEDYYNMAFRIWCQLTNATGIAFEEVWRSQR